MKRESGNALFLILIAVALFAALSYAITQSGRGGAGIDKEQAGIAAAQLAQYAAQIEQTIMRMQVVSGCSTAKLSFYHDSSGDGVVQTDGTDVYYNSNSPTPDECHVFYKDGGGMTYQAPNDQWLDGTNTSAFGYGKIFITGSTGVLDVGSSLGDLLLFIPYLSEDVCKAIVKNFQDSSDIPLEDTHAWSNVYYTGTFTTTRVVDNVTGYDNIEGHRTGCFEGNLTPAGGYHFYHVLIAY